MKFSRFLGLLLVLFAGLRPADAEVIFSDNFNRAASTNIGNGWHRAGRSIIDNENLRVQGIPRLGLVYAYHYYSDSYRVPLAELTGNISWNFNLRLSKHESTGLDAQQFGAAFILNGNSPNIPLPGSKGYAIVVGKPGSLDPISLVSFDDGFYNANLSDVIVAPAGPFGDIGGTHLSIRVTYEPMTNLWSLWARDDGSAGFSDPASGSLTLLGSAVDTRFVQDSLTLFAAYGNTEQDDFDVYFDNVSIAVSPVPEVTSMMYLGTIAFGMCGLFRRRRIAL